LETTQTDSSWHNKPTVIKGDYGERIIYEFLKNKGWIAYKAVTEGGHCFDFLATKDRKELRIVEVKTKARRNLYPDTGFEIRHYEEYKRIMEKHNLAVFIAFADEGEGRIYGNFLTELEKPKILTANGKQIVYPYMYHKNGADGTIYFPLENMVTIAAIKKQDIDFLRNHSARNYEYVN